MSACIAACVPSAARPAPGTCKNTLSTWFTRIQHARPKPDQQRKRLRRPLRQRQRLRFGERQRVVCPLDPAPRRAGQPGARGGVDLMVAMNPQTWDKDVASIEPGGYLFYDSTKPMPTSKFRADINVIGVPLTAITNSTYTDPRQRQLFKNIIYLGALCALLDMDPKLVEQLFGEQYKGKEKLLSSNVHALALGRDWALQNLKCPIGLRVKKADKVGDRIFMEGNSAAALGAVYGGATVCAWYPITPSSSLADAFGAHCKKLRHDPKTGKAKYAIVQGEDELASIGIVIGASWNGARAFTATSGPGISLMTE